MKRQQKILSLWLLVPIIYVVAVTLGGFLWTGYSHIRQPISELTMTSAPNLMLMRTVFSAYNVLLFGFAVCVYRQLKSGWGRGSAGALALVAVAGIIMLAFPQDPIGTKLTVSGLLHLVSAGAAAVATIAAIFAGGKALKSEKGGRRFWRLSLILGLIVIVVGGMTPMAISKSPDYFGLFERITIFSFLVWLALFAQALKSRTQYKEE